MPFAEVNGQRLYYEDEGNGPPVLFSHGYLMDRSMFDPQIAALSREFRCITWDERGFGQTESDGKPFSYWDSASDALGLLSSLGIERAVLAGMSQGGFLSLRAALAAPERVKALVLIDTQSGVEDPNTVDAYRGMFEMWVSSGSDTVAPAVAQIILGPGADDEGWIAKWRAIPVESMRPAFDCLMDRDDVTDRLSEVACPALVVHGEDDAAIPIAIGEELCAALSGCVGLVRVPGAGHASNLTHPEVVNPPLLDFLRAHA
jgi:pimeloyl-ACP methyl ester carboxylesterase